MNFFGKNKDKKDKNVQEFVVPQPQQEWIRQEAIRQQRPRELMTAPQLQRTREAKRLAETKRNNLEESIQRLHDQQEWLRKYTKLTMRLKEEKDRMYQLNREHNTTSKEEESLERYESFEVIQGDFERMLILKRFVDENRKQQTGFGQETDTLQTQWEEQLKRLKQQMEEYDKTSRQLHQSQDLIAQGHFLDGQINTLSTEKNNLQKLIIHFTSQKEALEQQVESQSEENEILKAELERLRAGRQSIEMHESMIGHAESILAQLDLLSELKSNLTSYANRQKERTKKQNELNEQLGRTFTHYQDVEAKMQTYNDELQIHRQEIKGLDSYQLQERAMQLKSRRQMLLSAMSLWNRICTGYTVIEEKRQQLNSLRLKIEHATTNLKGLETEINKLSRMCHEKEYTYLLSKGQDIIQLRADLKEGAGCPVCGATHHPYHSDTMLEQSKLISEFKTEFELLNAELQNKEALRTDLRLELSEMQGQRKAEEATLLTALQRQEEDVKEWQLFSTLDISFHDCTPSTNREARMAMIRQLIVNVTKDEEEAQKKLDFFNYRQNSITELSEKIATLEIEKSELSTRLNEVNTGCQVMAGQVDYIQENIDYTNRQFRQAYESVGALVTIPDWFTEWEQNNENLKQRILQLADGWSIVNKKINSTKEDLQEGESNLTALKSLVQTVSQTIELLTSRQKECTTDIQECHKLHEKALGASEAKDYYLNLHKLASDAYHNLSEEQERTSQMRKKIDAQQGQMKAISQWGEQLNEQHAEQRQKLDLWIHNYNAQHPPVQYSELEQLFQTPNDWAAIRKKVRKLHIDIKICQTRIEQLQAELTVMQAEGGRVYIQEENADLQEKLVAQRANLEQKLHDITLQIAKLDIALEEHEKASLEGTETEASSQSQSE